MRKFFNHILRSRTRAFDVVLVSCFLFVTVLFSASMVSENKLKESLVKFGKALEQTPSLHENAGFADSSGYTGKTLKIAVLPPKDELLYRTVFTLQKKGFFDKTSSIVSEVGNKGLIGHVLADKYLNSQLSFSEASSWLHKYSYLPQANEIYQKASKLADFDKNSIRKPKSPSKSKNLANADSYSLRPNSQLMTLSVSTDAPPLDVEETETNNLSSASAMWDKGLAAWKRKEFESASYTFSRLALYPNISDQVKARAGFWAYRSYERIRNKDKALYWLSFSSEFPNSFYGVMASHLLTKVAISKRTKNISILTESDINYLSAHPAGWRALALVQVGRPDLAEKELEQVLSSNPTPAVNSAAFALAEHAGIASILQRTSGLSKIAAQTNIDKAYPTPDWEPKSGWSVNPALIYAIVKQESVFKVGAVSPKGACGVMQIMPNTAKHIAKKTGGSTNIACADYNSNPEISLEMGQKYLRLLAADKTIGDNLLFLLAAYNAGPSKVANWIGSEPVSDSLLFIESLPFRETRNYVKQVMLNYWVYGTKIDASERSKQVDEIIALARGKWPQHKVVAYSAPSKKKDLKLSAL
ncbi:MAG: lytic transglycosylase domain-containing protein [Alphaproteobacteria bacterium]|nr:lytic transglycosylase domain-containing protein [Alphaproteobacteria bacterium]